MPARKPQQLAALRIGYQVLLVPAANAAKVVELLSEAVETRERYDDSAYYTIERPVEIGFSLVRPSQVRREPEADEPIRLPTRLTERAGIAGLLPAATEPLWSKIK